MSWRLLTIVSPLGVNDRGLVHGNIDEYIVELSRNDVPAPVQGIIPRDSITASIPESSNFAEILNDVKPFEN